jgi:DNA-binding response OmpR family regulator
MKILIAEDEPSLRENLQMMLEMEGYEVQLACDGQEAFELALRAPPDLVLTDVMMPVLDGYGLIRLLRGHPATAAVPIIVLTARAEQQDAEKVLALGADACLVKPYRRRELLEAVSLQAGPPDPPPGQVRCGG